MIKTSVDKLKSSGYLASAFLIPLAVRAISEIIAWPYPTGFDSLMYVNAMLKGYPFNEPLVVLLKSSSLFYILAWITNSVLGDLLVTMKVLGPTIFSVLCGSLYVYARAVLKWECWKSLLVSVLAGSYFMSLGMSWQMYRMTLGLAFFMFALTAERIERFKLKLATLTALCLLTVWTHEIAAITLFALSALLFVTRWGGIDRKTLVAVVPSGMLFLYQRYDPGAGSISIPSSSIQSASLVQSALYVSGCLLHMFMPISPLILLGLRRFRHADMLALSLICVFFAYMPVYIQQYAGYWYRWALILALPIFFFSAEGLEYLWRSGRTLNGRLRLGGVLALAIIAANLALTAYYVASPPESQIMYFGDWNNYKWFIPTSMLQNSVSIRDTPYVIEALMWVKSNLKNGEDALVLHEAVDNWAGIIVGNGIERVRVNEANISSPVRDNASGRLVEAAEAKLAEGKNVYTIWWVNGRGWYNMPALPEQFVKVVQFGNIAVYVYAP